MHKATEAYKGGVRSVRKGKRLEREAARLFGGARVPLSGMLDGHPNDVVLPSLGWRVEVKGRGRGLPFVYRWLESADVAAFREPGGPWLFAVTGERFRLLPGLMAADEAERLLVRLDPPPYELRLPGGLVLVPRERRGGLKTVRQWLAAEGADALLFKADRRGWIVVMDADHLVRLLSLHV